MVYYSKKEDYTMRPFGRFVTDKLTVATAECKKNRGCSGVIYSTTTQKYRISVKQTLIPSTTDVSLYHISETFSFNLKFYLEAFRTRFQKLVNLS